VLKFFILLADGHEAYRHGLARALAAHPRLALVAEASDGAPSAREAARAEPYMRLARMRMPDLDGLEVCRLLAGLDRRLQTMVVLIT